ncbi:MAG: YggT family protein [Thiotrichales bacterium]
MTVLNNVLVFLVDTLFSLYIAAVLIRFMLGLSKADFYNPISQFIVTITNPVLKPLRRIIPPLGRFDSATVVLLIALQFLKLFLIGMLGGSSVNPVVLLYLSVFLLLDLALLIYIFALVIQAIMSWVNPGAYMGGNPLSSILDSLTRPILAPLSQVVPRLGMVDITPLIAILLLQIGRIVLNGFY